MSAPGAGGGKYLGRSQLSGVEPVEKSNPINSPTVERGGV